MDCDQVQTVEQVFTELPGGDQFRQITVGCGDDAHIDSPRSARSQRFICSVLQHAQEFDLRARVQIADLIEKDRPAIGHLEAALAIRASVGECTSDVAEHLA
jgi:hypothetical protein